MVAEVTYSVGESFIFLYSTFILLIILQLLCMFFSTHKQDRVDMLVAISILVNPCLILLSIFMCNLNFDNSLHHSITGFFPLSACLQQFIIYGFVIISPLIVIKNHSTPSHKQNHKTKKS